jgi:iron complex transport system substrate-binding protein
MNIKQTTNYPSRIVCLTEESVETLYLLGEESRIVGVSSFVKRPSQAQKLPKVSLFTSSNIDKIKALKPDLVIGFSDIQKDVARELIGEGLNVFISNQRSIVEILDYINLLSRMVDKNGKGAILISELERKIWEAKAFAQTLKKRPRIYFEEWDEPMISCIGWVSDLIELCGGVDINREKSLHSLAKDRFTSNEEVENKDPNIIFGCWCGKKVKLDHFYKREDLKNTKAIKSKMVFELEPEIFLQPGPAPILEGIDIMINYIKQWSDL